MVRMNRYLREHWAALFLAAFLSLLVAFPQVAFRIEHRNDGVYQGIELLPDNSWPPRVREIQDGHGFGSIYYKDGKDDPYLFQPVGSMAVAYMGEAFGLDFNNTLLLSRVILAFIVFLLIYGFVFLFSRDKLVALSGGSLLLLADAVMNLSSLKQLLSGVSPSNFLNIGLPVNPAMIYIPLFAFLAAFWVFYQKRDYRWGIASAALLGLNFYVYFYSWTYLYAFGGFLVLLHLVRKQWREAGWAGSVFLGALLTTIPYGLNLYHASLYPTYEVIGQRFGIVLTHEPLFVGLTVTISLLIFLFAFPREDNRKYLFGLALLLAPFATMNQQIFTGKEMQAAHYHWYFHKPMAVIFISMIALYWLRRFREGWCRQAAAVFIIFSCFATGIFIQIDSYLSDRGDAGVVAVERQKYGPVMQWLNQNAVREEVVLSNNEVSYMVSMYTPLNVFCHRAAQYALVATEERLLDTIFAFYRLRGVGAPDAQGVFFAERGYISTYLYGIYYRQVAGSYEAIPDEKLNDYIARYTTTLATPASEWLKQKMMQYEVRYVVWDKKANPDWQIQKYPFFAEAAVFGDLVIYRFQQ